MAKVQDVARFFIDLAARQNDAEMGDLMTNLRLQKLLYFAQGWHLARFSRPLFEAPLKAWSFGPVVPEVYHAYKSNGRSGIAEKFDLPADTFTDSELELLLDVAREYADFSTSALVALSHKPDAPWSHTAQPGTISLNAIQDYFSKADPLSTFDDILDDYPTEVL